MTVTYRPVGRSGALGVQCGLMARHHRSDIAHTGAETETDDWADGSVTVRGAARRGARGRYPRGYGQGLGRHFAPSVVSDLVCCIITGASAPSLGQPTWSRPKRCPTSWLMSICR